MLSNFTIEFKNVKPAGMLRRAANGSICNQPLATDLRKPEMMFFRIFTFIFFLFSAATLKSQVLSPESAKSIELLSQAWEILDSAGLKVYPDWTGYRQIPVFIGAPGKQGIFINPDKELPKGYFRIQSDTSLKIYVNDSCNVGFSGGGVGVLIDNIYYHQYMKLDLYSGRFKDDYISFLEKYFSVDKLPDSVMWLIKSPEFYMATAFHEAFHVFQQKSKVWQPKRDINYLKPEIAALSCIEGLLLQEALYADKIVAVKESVKEFLIVREFKDSKLNKRQINYEEDYEWAEGTAMYIQTEILKTMLSTTGKQCLFYLDSLNFYNSMVNLNEPGNKDYYYGQAQAFLLDRLYGPGWKEKILSKNIFMTDLLKEAVRYKRPDGEQQLKQILTTFQYESMKSGIRGQFKKGHYIIDSQYINKFQ